MNSYQLPEYAVIELLPYVVHISYVVHESYIAKLFLYSLILYYYTFRVKKRFIKKKDIKKKTQSVHVLHTCISVG